MEPKSKELVGGDAEVAEKQPVNQLDIAGFVSKTNKQQKLGLEYHYQL
jgi:hypothetical protein